MSVDTIPRDAVAACSASGRFDPSDGIDLREAAALAVYLNPTLRELRAEKGVAAAQFIEAGLLPNPTIGWSAVDWLVDGTTDSVLTGFGLTWAVPRPGEIPARKRVARARMKEVYYSVMAAEWRHVRKVSLAWLEVLGARERIALNQRLLEIIRGTYGFLQRGRAAKTVTALQENLAGIDLANVEAERERLLVSERDAWQALDVLLGLPPEARFELQAPSDVFAFVSESPSADALVEEALASRPDLKELLAVYDQAEAALELEWKRRFPGIAIGTGISIELPIGSRFNRPAIQTRLAERNRARLQVEAAIHELRQEIYAALTNLMKTDRPLKFYQENIEPRLEESLRLSSEARGVTEITPLELLTAQEQVLQTQTRYLDLRIQHRKNRELVATLTGRWFAKPPPKALKESK
ncbi:MAG: TolC family protein [Planctomycetota bacterium]